MGRGFIFAVTLMLLPVTLVQATPNAYDDVRELDAKAQQAFAEANYYAGRGENDNACYFYKKAASGWQDGMWAAVGISRDLYSGDKAKRAIDLMGENKELADERAGTVCGKPNDPSMASSPAADVQVDYDPKEDVMLDLQALVKSGSKSGNAAYDLYEAGDYAGACTEAKLAAEAFTTASRAINEDPELGYAFANVEQLHIDAHDMVELRDTVYCAP